jgi:transcriptional regulator with XRE-family HTH domain
MENPMDEQDFQRSLDVHEFAREKRLERRAQVNRIKAEAVYLGGGQTVRLQGLRDHREAAGLSEQQLAKMIGTNQRTIMELEPRHALRGAYLFTVRRLCEALKTSPADLICRFEAPEEGAEGSYRWERVTRRKGLDRTEQLEAFREQVWYDREDSFRGGGWKVQLLGLKACRLAAGLAQRDLAKMIGKSQTTIAELERNFGASLRMMRRLCRTLNLLPADLICKGPVKQR